MKKLICLILSVVFSACMATSVSALNVDRVIDDEIGLQYVYTNYVTSTLNISSKTATCKSTVNGIPGKVTRITITQELQKKNGTSWKSILGRGTTVYTSSAYFV